MPDLDAQGRVPGHPLGSSASGIMGWVMSGSAALRDILHRHVARVRSPLEQPVMCGV